MTGLVTNRLLARELEQRGLLPANCRLVEIQVAVDGGIVLRYDKTITAAEFIRVADALTAVAERAA
jgi:hypothetical protein